MSGRARSAMCCALSVVGVVGVLAAPAQAAVVNVPADLACVINAFHQNNNECGGESVEAGVLGTHDLQPLTALMKFDVDAALPADAVVMSAKLHLTGSGGGEIHAYSLSSDWDDTVTFTTAPGRSDSVDTQEIGTSGVTFDVTDPVRAWAAGDTTNYGLAVGVDETEYTGGYGLFSAPSEGPPDAPRLAIEYFVGCPSDPYAAAQTSSKDTVYDVQEMVLNVFREGGPPTTLSRAGAMAFIGVYDVFNSVFFAKLEDLSTGNPTSSQVCGWEPFSVLADADPSTNTRLAAGIAARDILVNALPNRTTKINSEYSRLFGSETPQTAAEDLGEFVADEVIADRTGDGSGSSMSYTSASTTAGAWRPTPSLSTSPGTTCDTDMNAVGAGWGNVTPFAMTSGSQFRQTLPGGYTSYSALLASSYYAYFVNEVKNYGGAGTTLRGLPETKLAWFWANDLDGTYKPPGQLLEHTESVAQSQPAAETSGDPDDFFQDWSRQGIRVARLFAEVSVAMADAAIAAWDEKYLTAIDLWRPESAIHEPQSDGNSATTPDTNWKPLSAGTDNESFSPCFPAWVSGHATFGGAWGEAMNNEFLHTQYTDPFPLTLTSEDPHAIGLSATSRQFYSFDAAAEENAISRIYLGVHYRFDAVDGLATGRGVAEQVAATKFRWNKTCLNWACGETIP